MSKTYFICYIYHNNDYLDYLSSFRLMFLFHHEVKLKVLLHCEDTHIQGVLDDVPFLDALLIFYFHYSTKHVSDKAVSKHGCCRQP